MRTRILILLLLSLSSATGCASWPFSLLSDYYSAGDNTYAGKRQHYEDQQARWASSQDRNKF